MQLHAPANLFPGKEPPAATGYEAGWAPEPVWKQKRRENIPSLPRTGNEPRSLLEYNSKVRRENIFKPVTENEISH